MLLQVLLQRQYSHRLLPQAMMQPGHHLGHLGVTGTELPDLSDGNQTAYMTYTSQSFEHDIIN